MNDHGDCLRAGARKAGLAAMLLAVGGCRSLPPGPAVLGPSRPAEAHIQVVHAVPRFQYVVLECVPALPEGTGVELFRQGLSVAEVRLTGIRRPGLVAADVIAGDPLPGDLGKIRFTVEEALPHE